MEKKVDCRLVIKYQLKFTYNTEEPKFIKTATLMTEDTINKMIEYVIKHPKKYSYTKNYEQGSFQWKENIPNGFILRCIEWKYIESSWEWSL